MEKYPKKPKSKKRGKKQAREDSSDSESGHIEKTSPLKKSKLSVFRREQLPVPMLQQLVRSYGRALPGQARLFSCSHEIYFDRTRASWWIHSLALMSLLWRLGCRDASILELTRTPFPR